MNAPPSAVMAIVIERLPLGDHAIDEGLVAEHVAAIGRGELLALPRPAVRWDMVDNWVATNHEVIEAARRAGEPWVIVERRFGTREDARRDADPFGFFDEDEDEPS